MIRIYGHHKGESSFVQVTRGMRVAAKSIDLLAGEVAVDMLEQERASPGADAPIGLFCGAPLSTALGPSMGLHKEHWLVLAPNSYGIPPPLKQRLAVPGTVTGFLAPSAWAADVLRAEFPSHRVLVSPHGVHPEVHLPSPEAREARIQEYQAGTFRVAHFTSTLGQRKGTLELLRAWRNWSDRPAGALLLVVANPLAVNEYLWRTREMGLDPSTVSVVANPEAPASVLAAAVRHAHVVCQPSRAEGFGLLPLEARACGVPVVMTNCTGHTEFWSPQGTVTVAHGELDALDDYPGAMAPLVTTEAIREALIEAFETWPALADEAARTADAVRSAWSWQKRNAPVLRELVDGTR